MASYNAKVAATMLAMTLTSDQTLFLLYHSNSYASNPVLLRSSKPMVMRDVFLTKSKSLIPNPLSSLYVSTVSDCVANCIVSWFVVKPVAELIGVRRTVAFYLTAGFFSSFAYLFAAQTNPSRMNSDFDCTATSNGAFAGICVLSLLLPKCYIPWSKRTPAAYVATPYLLKCFYDEFVGPRFVEKRRPGDIELRNWGIIGGCFFAVMYGSLFMRTKTDARLMHRFYDNVAKR